MNCLSRLHPGAMLLMVGLLPLATSQARAQSSSATSLLSVGVIALPSDTMNDTVNTNPDSNFDPLGDLALPDSDPLSTQEGTTLSHSGSGSNSGWLIGGTLGAAAGIAGLVSGGGGSSAATLLRTPAFPPGPAYATELGNVVTPGTVTLGNGSNVVTSGGSVTGTSGNSNIVAGGSSNTVTTGVSNAVTTGSKVGSSDIRPLSEPGGGLDSGSGGIGPLAITPEPGPLALLSGMGLVFTGVKLRRRKR